MDSNDDFSPIKLRNRYVSDILNDPPHWFVRVGGFLMLFLVGITIGICMLIRYPDTISAQATLNHHTGQYTLTVPYSPLAASAPIGATARIELDNRPHQQYGYVYATITHKSYTARTQTYTIVLTPTPHAHKNKATITTSNTSHGTATIMVRERSLLERMCVSLKF